MTTETSPETPILFSAPMIQALLAGQKTQTRRVLTRENTIAYFGNTITRLGRVHWPRLYFAAAKLDQWSNAAGPFLLTPMVDALDGCVCRVYPRAYKGERMWVRETFASFDSAGRRCKPRLGEYAVLADGTQLARDGRVTPPHPEYARGAFDGIKWRPGIHMPRWASRLTLSVTEVQVQRLQDIGEHDAMAEGVRDWVRDTRCETARAGFRVLWDSINGDRAGCSWADNPWVIARTFTVEPAPCASPK